jgi:8-oxo-dGTP pyrophosphatase MutT (NUDIX family)
MGRDVYQTITSKLAKDEPRVVGKKLAAVSIILSGKDSPQVLLIKRAERAGDPWSGQVALPGGKFEDVDSGARAVAVRETREEVGIDLEAAAEFLGYYEPIMTHTGTMDVVPSVYLLRGEVKVTPNEEVSSYRWIDLGRLLGPESRSTYRLPFGGGIEMPAAVVDDYLVWGLTYRILSSLAGSPDVTLRS